MSIRATILVCFIPVMATAQRDSIDYFKKQLKRNGLSDSTKAWYHIKIGEKYNEVNPAGGLNDAIMAYKFATASHSSKMISLSTHNIASSYSALGRFDSSLYYARQSLEQARMGHDAELIFKALNLVGSAHIKKEQLSEALKIFDEAQQLAAVNPAIPHRSKAWLGLSNYHFVSLRFKKAIEVLRQGEVIAEKEKGKDDLMDIYSSLGLNYVFSGKADSGHYYQLKALDYFKKAGKSRGEAVALLRMGIAHGLFSNPSMMEDYHERAYTVFKSLGDDMSAINALMSKVNFYFRSFQFDKCLRLLNNVEPQASELGHRETIALSFIYRSGIFSLMRDTARAAKYHKLAEILNRELKLPSFEKMNMMIRAIVASTEFKKGDTTVNKALLTIRNEIPEQLRESSLQSISLSKTLMKENQEDFINTYKIFSPSDSSNAGKFFDSLVSRPLDSNLNVITGKQLLELETRYKTQQKEDSIRTQSVVLDLRDKTIRNRNYFLAGLAALVLIVTILFIQSRKKTAKINRQYEEISQLQSELTHRTGNFFNSIKGMLAAAATTSIDQETLRTLDSRIGTINQLYKTLYSSPGALKPSFADLLGSLCKDFEHSFGTEKNIRVFQSCSVEIAKNESEPLAFIITELLTNSAKHAFEAQARPEIHITLSQNGSKRILYVRDNGIGADTRIETRTGARGMGIVKGYGKRLGAAINTWSENGFHFKMEF